MAGKVDFYLLAKPVANGSRQLACRVVEKAWKKGLRVALCVDDEHVASEMDDLLWSFSQSSFIPHSLGIPGCEDPVLIFSELPRALENQNTMLISMRSEALPENFLDFRIADIIGDSDTDKAEARKRFKFYREQGIEPGTHKV